jgi:RNA polymerase sigma-70 factor (ECF subfamily)
MNDIRRDIVALLPRLRRFALTFTRTAAEADELVRLATTRAIEKSYHWKGEGRIENWLFSLIRASWADERKKQQTRGQLAGTAQESVLGKAGMSSVLDLEESFSGSLLLVNVEGFSYSEAAAILGISSDNLASCLCAARLNLAADGIEHSERRA